MEIQIPDEFKPHLDQAKRAIWFGSITYKCGDIEKTNNYQVFSGRNLTEIMQHRSITTLTCAKKSKSSPVVKLIKIDKFLGYSNV